MLRLSNFVMGRKKFYNLNRGSVSQVLNVIESLNSVCENSSHHINTIFTHFHTCVMSQNVENITFRERVLDLRPKSVCSAEMKMNFHWHL